MNSNEKEKITTQYGNFNSNSLQCIFVETLLLSAIECHCIKVES